MNNKKIAAKILKLAWTLVADMHSHHIDLAVREMLADHSLGIQDERHLDELADEFRFSKQDIELIKKKVDEELHHKHQKAASAPEAK